MKHPKKFLALLPCTVIMMGILLASAIAAETNGLDNFKKVNIYEADTFSDVSTSDWYYDNVKAAYELGLMIGQGENFGVDSDVTVAETVTLAARLHSIYTGDNEQFEQGTPWYQAYVDYIASRNLVSLTGLDMSAPATRAQYATILSASFPDEALEPINQIADGYVPDVKMDAAYSNAIYRLYRAGILTGNDDKGTFSPDSNIMRSEVAAIISRMANEEKRIVKKTGENQGDASVGTIDTPAVEAAIHSPSFIIGSSTVKRGSKSVPITIALRKNPGIASIGLTVSFDNALTLTDVKYTDTFVSNAVLPQKTSNPVKLIWVDGTQNVEGDCTFATLYLDVAEDASIGSHQIAAVYDEDDIFRINKNKDPFEEENVPFEVIFGSINVTD